MGVFSKNMYARIIAILFSVFMICENLLSQEKNNYISIGNGSQYGALGIKWIYPIAIISNKIQIGILSAGGLNYSFDDVGALSLGLQADFINNSSYVSASYGYINCIGNSVGGFAFFYGKRFFLSKYLSERWFINLGGGAASDFKSEIGFGYDIGFGYKL